jgi:hypothetical protein
VTNYIDTRLQESSNCCRAFACSRQTPSRPMDDYKEMQLPMQRLQHLDGAGKK